MALLALSACEVDTPTLESVQDARVFNRRMKETPRQRGLRECRQECERFRVECLLCHSTADADAIRPPDDSQLTAVGERARIMRSSPTFGLNTNCAVCHQSKFRLTRAAEKSFGPGAKN